MTITLDCLIKLLFLLTCVQAATREKAEQIHLSLGTDSSSEMVITWTTMKPIKANESCVMYGLDESSLIDKHCGSSRMFVDDGSQQIPRWIHRVFLTKLQPNTRYHYQVIGSDNKYSFRTLRSGASWSPSLLILGDLGYENAVCLEALKQEVRSDRYDLTFHVGDIGYDLNSHQGKLGDKYMNLIEPLAATIAYQVTMGNHENAYNFSHYQERFTMFDQLTKNQQNSFYSFNVGLLHVVVFSSEFYTYTEYGTDQIISQLNWLKEDLRQANLPENRRLRPWIVTMSHKPFYCDEKRCTEDAINLRKSLEKLFFDNEVDMMFVGHEHKYQRSWPVYNRVVFNGSYDNPYVNPIAPVQIVTGSAGNYEKIDPFTDLLPYNFTWRARSIYDYSYTRLHVINETHLHMQQVSPQQVVVDEIHLVKENRHKFYQLDQLTHFIDQEAPQFRYKIW